MSKEKETKTAEETEAMSQEVETASTAKETKKDVISEDYSHGVNLFPNMICKSWCS